MGQSDWFGHRMLRRYTKRNKVRGLICYTLNVKKVTIQQQIGFEKKENPADGLRFLFGCEKALKSSEKESTKRSKVRKETVC